MASRMMGASRQWLTADSSMLSVVRHCRNPGVPARRPRRVRSGCDLAPHPQPRPVRRLHSRHTSSRNVVRRLVRTALQQFSHVRRPKSWTMAGECKRTSFVVMTPAIMANLLTENW